VKSGKGTKEIERWANKFERGTMNEGREAILSRASCCSCVSAHWENCSTEKETQQAERDTRA
jgi:hypothetical protein